MRLLVTGGAGFIGSAVVRHCLGKGLASIGVLDAMTYAASPRTLAPFGGRADFVLYERNICAPLSVRTALREFEPDAIMHLAAESHVDRSIDKPAAFVQTNVVGTQVMLDEALAYWRSLSDIRRARFRFHHISTDEVFGSLGDSDYFHENTRYDPRSPYSASKAASDHLVRAWHHTFGLPVVLTNCTNNYGPYQFPEKLVPLMILRGLSGQPMPVYGDGQNVRDWLFVDDHAEALWTVLTLGKVGDTYAIGGMAERRNLDVVNTLASHLDELAPCSTSRKDLIQFVPDRPGHDRRYAMDCGKIRRELGWSPKRSFEDGLRETVRWYLDHRDWWEPLVHKTYRLERLGGGVA
ncbi:MAG: dTDP-glucose 4,6-dehydratase [Alphaproteobacteria bacterium]|nr:dTDP-glucose 4,6-dehydratase [Alphaproteobacteria bacterium]MBV9062553.1 dTDP-glucose 4,6-dehydratase [Alphaproteobacteria bacterium]